MLSGWAASCLRGCSMGLQWTLDLPGYHGVLITPYIVVYTVGSPVPVTITSRVAISRGYPSSPSPFYGGQRSRFSHTHFRVATGLKGSSRVRGSGLRPTSRWPLRRLWPTGEAGASARYGHDGLTVAFPFRIPLCTLVGDYFSWRAAFVLVGVLETVAVLGHWRVSASLREPAPREPPGALGSCWETRGLRYREPHRYRARVRLRGIRPTIGMRSCASSRVRGIGIISAVLLLFGIAGVAGNSLGGYDAGRLATGGVWLRTSPLSPSPCSLSRF